jgi:prolyl oligopeptidase
MTQEFHYPPTHTVAHVDDFFGTPVADPYRWLENASDPEVLHWTQQQQDFAEEYLQRLPGRERFFTRLQEVWNYPKYGAVVRRESRIFFTRNDGLQPQAVLYVQDGKQEPRVLIDPNQWSTDGTVALVDWVVDATGDKLAYAVSESGLDWRVLRVLDTHTGKDTGDVVEKVKFSSASWSADSSGFYYSRFPDEAADEGEANRQTSHRVYYHQLGTEQGADEEIYRHPELQGITIWAETSDDGRYLILAISGDSFVFNRLYVMDLTTRVTSRLFDQLDAAYQYIANDAQRFYILTTKDAPAKRLVAFDLEQPEQWQAIIPATKDVIASCSLVNEHFVVTYMRDAYHLVKIFDKHGHFIKDVELPGLGSAGGDFHRAHRENHDVFFSYTSFLSPSSILRYDFDSDQLASFFNVTVPGFDPEQYETRQVFFSSRDGTQVPMFITARKGITLDGSHPTILYGYGGYDISLTPSYSSWMPVWLEHGGVFALANLRGGGEYGEKWHLAGMLDQKQNTFDDFIGAAEWLIENGYTTSKRLAIEGGSNGGLLVAACMIQRPDLYGAVLCHVPVIDMLRFQHFTAGRYWTSEYGDADSSPEHFDFLFKYSPLHNVQAGMEYPPILIMSADHDDRVVPMHSKKFAAALQNGSSKNNVVLLRIDTKAGHGLGKPTAKLIDQRVDVFAFLAALFEMKV